MLLKQLALAASAAAFLVVPDIPVQVAGQDEDLKALPISNEINTPSIFVIPQSESIQVPCAGCKGHSPSLGLDFVVEDGSRLTLNGYELYPVADPWNNDLSATVVTKKGKTSQQRLGYSLAVMPHAAKDELAEVIAMELRIIEVGPRFVDDIPTISIKLIKMNQGGDLILGNINLHDNKAGGNVGSLRDRIKAKIDRYWGKFKSWGKCKHHKHHKHQGHSDDIVTLEGQRPSHDSKPHHHVHGHGFHRHDWGRLLKNIASNILLPVLTGITAGVGIAVLAMGFCSVIAVVFAARRKRCQRRRRSSRKNRASTTEPAVAEEKAGLIEQDVEEEPLPKYQDHPTTEEQA